MMDHGIKYSIVPLWNIRFIAIGREILDTIHKCFLSSNRTGNPTELDMCFTEIEQKFKQANRGAIEQIKNKGNDTRDLTEKKNG
jgi:hypothetical protein